ncbi:MAG TPA: hypothetical protein VFZ35_05945 [Sphingomicrobium sp.]
MYRTVLLTPLLLLSGPALAQQQAAPQPQPERCTGEEYRALDYMLGDWRVVHTANGRLMGHNRVEWANLGCAIRESLTFAGRGQGSSIYFYSPIDRRWHGHYHDSIGLFAVFLGGIEDGRHVISSNVRFPQDPQREWQVRQATFRDSAGRPRQTGERWLADSQQWEQIYDVTFCPLASPAGQASPCR